ncbi:unnamed protein product [Paramecium sonneborni]|uniref:Uncharacterized protein n=1 Tax=Paramecium sonneborni TaxID=65129 RepID=A0A8S1Q8G7_9CILI|nr:unnamed protein product [Paramecium sonneborni]
MFEVQINKLLQIFIMSSPKIYKWVLLKEFKEYLFINFRRKLYIIINQLKKQIIKKQEQYKSEDGRQKIKQIKSNALNQF